MNELRDPSFGVLLLVHQQIIYVYCDGSIKRAHADRVDTPQYVVTYHMINVLYSVEGEPNLTIKQNGLHCSLRNYLSP